jgi:large subunit ribosomal protein L11
MPPKSKVSQVVRIQQPAGEANIAKMGQVLGAYGVNIVQVSRDFNEATAGHRGLDVAADIVIYEDRSAVVEPRTPTTASLIKRSLSIKKGSQEPGKKVAGKVSQSTLREVAQIKLVDLNVADMDAAMKIVAGTARSMGLEIDPN